MSCFADFILCKPWLLQDNIKTTNCHQNWSILLFTDALQARQLKLNLYYGSEASQISATPLNSWLLLYVLLNLKHFYYILLYNFYDIFDVTHNMRYFETFWINRFVYLDYTVRINFVNADMLSNGSIIKTLKEQDWARRETQFQLIFKL